MVSVQGSCTPIPGVSGVEELQLLKNEGRAYFPQNVDNQ